MSFTFPYQYGFIENRKIPYPIVSIYLDTVRGRRSFSFIMDTGADNLTLPHHMIFLLGLKKKNLKESRSQGIGYNLVKTWESKIIIGFCGLSFPVHCSFTDNDKTPFLLGKEDIFDKFNLIFDNENQSTGFEDKKRKK